MAGRINRSAFPRFSLREKINQGDPLLKEDFSYGYTPGEDREKSGGTAWDLLLLNGLKFMHSHLPEKIMGVMFLLTVVYLLNFLDISPAEKMRVTLKEVTTQDLNLEEMVDNIVPILSGGVKLSPFEIEKLEKDYSYDSPRAGVETAGNLEAGVGKAEKMQFYPPVHGALAGKFGLREDPFTGVTKMYYGMDIMTGKGEPVRAAGAGRVTKADPGSGRGITLEIEHGGGYVTSYGGLSGLLVRGGELVQAGDTIGRMGEEGNPIFHFQIRKDGRPLDPRQYFWDMD